MEICRVKPYEIISREKVEQEVVEKEVENIIALGGKAEDKEEFDDDEMDEDKFEVARDAIGEKNMEMERSMCFFGECYIHSGSSSI